MKKPSLRGGQQTQPRKTTTMTATDQRHTDATERVATLKRELGVYEDFVKRFGDKLTSADSIQAIGMVCKTTTLLNNATELEERGFTGLEVAAYDALQTLANSHKVAVDTVLSLRQL